MTYYFELLSEVTRYLLGKEANFQCADERLLFQVLREHRLVGRFLAVYAERSANLPLPLLEDLRKEHSAAWEKFQEDLDALGKLLNDDRLSGVSFVLLKGHGSYFRHRRQQDIRETHDVDLIATNIEEVAFRLSAMADKSFSSISPHEILNAHVIGLNIDLHRYYPVWSTTSEAGSVTGKGRDRFHHGELIVRKLGIASLVRDGQAPIIKGKGCLYLPDPAASVLVHCAHCYRNVISRSSVSIRNIPPIRLIELLEIADDLQSPTFDEVRFIKLVEETDAYVSVAWTARSMLTMLGDSSLMGLLERHGLPGAGFNFNLYSIWGGFWGSLPRHERNIFERHLETSTITDMLGVEAHTIDENGVFSFRIGDNRRVSSHLGFVSPEKSLPLHGEIWIKDDMIAFDLSVLARTDAPNRRVHFDVLGGAFEHNWNTVTGTTRWKTSLKHLQPDVHFSSKRDVYSLHVRIKSGELREARRVPILIAAGEFLEEHVMKAGTLLPLELSRR